MKKVLIVIILIAIGLIGNGCSVQPSGETTPPAEEEVAKLTFTNVSAEEAKALIDKNPDLMIIDVSPHYDEGHIPGAINYFLGDGALDNAIPALDPKATYLVYCHYDLASMTGAQALADAGFENVYRLEGNYASWVKAEYPVE
jgi:thiosulfate sulfurtransferase